MAGIYGNWFEGCLNRESTDHEWNEPATNGIRIVLVTDGYTFGKEETVIGTAVGTVGGERASGTTDDNPTTINDAVASAGQLDGDTAAVDTTWTAVAGSQTVDACVYYALKTGDSDSLPISYNDFVTPVVCNGSNVKVTWGAAIWRITY